MTHAPNIEPTALLEIKTIFLIIGVLVAFLVYKTISDPNHPKKITTALFWGLFGSIFLFGDASIAMFGAQVTHTWVGLFVIGIAILAGFGLVSMGSYQTTSQQEKESYANKYGNKLFVPAVLIPIVTVFCTILLNDIHLGSIYLFDQQHITLGALTLACAIALVVGWKITGGTPLLAMSESRRLVDSIGWAAILPQMLAMLGGVFIVAQTGDSIQSIVTLFVTPDNRFALVAIYCIGMALFTMIMGNAFAAFPVMTAGIAMPFLIQMHGANPAALVAIGMYSGYCGTLMTPMAANFNIVPAALLDLKDKYQVIKVQIPTALILLSFNIVLMYSVIF
ncbi:FIG001614: Membrane protein [Pseudoalteromonas luteoviolacea B = ATCC 29581]|nr:FIG001614: Membrane protein [Pseudoalteromonas luteoviolacea B = ATCC 29581]